MSPHSEALTLLLVGQSAGMLASGGLEGGEVISHAPCIPVCRMGA